MSNEFIFYGGIGLTALSLLAGLLGLLLWNVKRAALNARLDQEYGALKRNVKHAAAKEKSWHK